MRNGLQAGFALALCLVPAAAMAHTGTGAHIDALHGFLHPLTGLDHVLAMVAVGVFATQLGGRSLWAVPAAFVLAMTVGGAAGYYGMQMPLVEQGIAASVITMSLAVAVGVRMPTIPAMGLVAAFALFHGHAHGAEGTAAGSFAGYAVGFVVATALLHAVGVMLGLMLNRRGEVLSVNGRRLLGAIGTVAGAALLVG